MKTKALHMSLLLLVICLLLSACHQQKLDPADYDLPADVQVEKRPDGRVWVVKQKVEKALPITLPETEDFALRSAAIGSFFDLKKQRFNHDPIVHARYDENKYYIRFFDDEWIYAPDENGTYWLYEPRGNVFRKQKSSKTEEEVKEWFFTDLSEGSVSIAMLLGVWGEPTGRQEVIHIYDYNRGNGDYVLCDEYNFHGILQYVNPKTGLAASTLACCDWREMAPNYSDITTSSVYYLMPAFEGDNVWQNVSVKHQKPLLKD